MSEIRKNSVLRAIHISCNVFITRALIYLCVLTHVLVGKEINAKYVFGISLFYELLRQCASQAFAQGITQVAEAVISTRRIKEFLLYDEQEVPLTIAPFSIKKEEQKTGPVFISGVDTSRPIGVTTQNLSANWIKGSEDYSLKDIDFNATSGELAIVIGNVRNNNGETFFTHLSLKLKVKWVVGKLPYSTSS